VLRIADGVVLGAAALLFSISIWILIPVPHVLLLPLAVGTPELSPVLLAASGLLSLVAGRRARRSRLARLALVTVLASALPPLVPLAQLHSTLTRFDAAMASTSVDQPGMRSRPVVAGEIFRGFDPPSPVRVTRGITFAQPVGVPLMLDVYRPQASGRFPVLLQVHGGSWQRGSAADDSWFASYFAARGYVVVAVDYRHAPRWKWPNQLDDLRSSVRWIAAHAAEFDGDASRMVLLGRSAGAHLAMSTAYRDSPSAIRAVVSFYGPVDLAEGWRHPPRPDPLDVRRILETFLGGTPDQWPARYTDASPIARAAAGLPPTLLIYGARDHIVESRFGAQLHHALSTKGTTSVFLELPWSEHAFDAVPNGLGGQIALYYTERFLAWAVNNR
jgi:acetyl esterase/lipase